MIVPGVSVDVDVVRVAVLVSDEVVSVALVVEVVVVGVEFEGAVDAVGMLLWDSVIVPEGLVEVVFSDCWGAVVAEAPPFPRHPAEKTTIPASAKARSWIRLCLLMSFTRTITTP